MPLNMARYHQNMTISLSETIGSAVRSHRERRGMSQAELARRMKNQGYSWYPATVARTETGERPLRLDEALSLAGILGVTIQALYTAPTASSAEEDQLVSAIMQTERMLTAAEAQAARAQARAQQSRVAATELKEKRDNAEAELDQAIAEMHAAEQEAARSAEEAAVARVHMDRLRSQLVRSRLRPGDHVNVTLHDVDTGATRFTKRADGVIFELVNKEGDVVMRSQPFENEQIAKEQAAYVIDRYGERVSGRADDDTPSRAGEV